MTKNNALNDLAHPDIESGLFSRLQPDKTYLKNKKEAELVREESYRKLSSSSSLVGERKILDKLFLVF